MRLASVVKTTTTVWCGSAQWGPKIKMRQRSALPTVSWLCCIVVDCSIVCRVLLFERRAQRRRLWPPHDACICHAPCRARHAGHGARALMGDAALYGVKITAYRPDGQHIMQQRIDYHLTFVGQLVVLFCSLAVLDPRVGHTMDVLSLFIPVLCNSDWLFHGVHVLMLSIQAVRGLPRLREPGIVPCIISFSRQLPCFLMVWS